jgi:hypothetical protein
VHIRGRRDLESEWHWRNILKEWDASGLNAAQYCRDKGIVYSQFRDWRIEIKKRDAEIEAIELKSSDKTAVEESWRQIIAEWHSSGLSAMEYCRRKQIIYWQFTGWKQKIIALDRKRERAARKAVTHSKKAGKGMKQEQPGSEQTAHSIEFAEVRLTETSPNPQALKPPHESHRVEILLPTGVVVRMDDCTASFLSSVISTLEKH